MQPTVLYNIQYNISMDLTNSTFIFYFNIITYNYWENAVKRALKYIKPF